ncbi:MAG TPA: HAMP domain-containing sensor histidine kinase, partial [Humisphaera sp.]
SKLPGLGKAAEMIRSQPDPAAFLAADPKGRQLPAYLAKLADLLAAEQEAVRAELAHLARGLDHIKGIVASQQKFAKARAVLEPVPLAELVEDAARINQLGDGVPGGGVEFVRDFRCEPTVTTDRHKVMQILVNLLKNAREAVAAGPGPARRITVGIARAADDGAGGGGAGGFDVTVTDTGVGIAADRLGRLFQHGYTTRKDGHGFGLHAAAIDARNLGGSLSARSDGVGLGATFTLRVVSAKPVGPAADTDSTAAPPVARAA